MSIKYHSYGSKNPRLLQDLQLFTRPLISGQKGPDLLVDRNETGDFHKEPVQMQGAFGLKFSGRLVCSPANLPGDYQGFQAASIVH